MLSTTPENLYEEIMSAERLRDSHIAFVDDLVSSYVGPAWSGDKSIDSDYTPENHVYEFLSLTVPKIIYDNPRTHVKTRRMGPQQEVAKAIQLGLNRWVKDANLRQVLTQIAYDMLFSYGVALVAEETRPGYDPSDPSVVQWPQVYRISPRRFFMDPYAHTFNEARFMGHKWVRDKSDLLVEAEDEDSGWNTASIEAVSEDSGVDELERNSISGNNTPTRKEIVGYEIWVPEARLKDGPGPDDGYNGVIYTIAMYQEEGEDGSKKKKSDFIRDPRPYYGPKTGPYAFFGVYTVPDSPFPLSPLLATSGQAQELNEHVRAASKSAARYKKGTMIDAKKPQLAKALANAPDDYIIPVDGLDRDAVVPYELGGVTRPQIDYIAMARDRLDRNSGIHDAQRGNVGGRATATEVAVADTASTIRMDYLKRQFADCVQAVLHKAGWYLYHDDRIVFPLGEEGVEAMGMEEPWFTGGLHDSQSGYRYEDLELEIDPMSMERTNEALNQRRTVEAFQLIMNVAPLIPQVPWIDWREVFDRLGEAYNIPDFGDMIQGDKIPEAPLPPDNIPMLQSQMGNAKGMSTPGGAAPSVPGSPGMNSGLAGVSTGQSMAAMAGSANGLGGMG